MAQTWLFASFVLKNEAQTSRKIQGRHSKQVCMYLIHEIRPKTIAKRAIDIPFA